MRLAVAQLPLAGHRYQSSDITGAATCSIIQAFSGLVFGK